MRSSVKGTRGSIDIIDLVRKSSGVIIGVVRDENDLAADLKAFKEAVKFDLNADFLLGGSGPAGRLLCSFAGGSSKTLKSSSSKSKPATDNGSMASGSPVGDRSGCNLLLGYDLLPRELGVMTELKEGEDSSMDASSREGIDSLDIVLEDMMDSLPFSLPHRSSSNSSGAPSRKSSGLLPSDMLSSFSETSVFCKMESTVSRCPAPLFCRTLFLYFCGGIDVSASSAATEGGIASGEWTVR